jgi:biotin carboxyl carrier protein
MDEEKRAPGQGIFRAEALHAVESADATDAMSTVVRPAAWMVLGAVALVVASAVVWAFTGRINSVVSAEGILLRGGEVLAIDSPVSGTVRSVSLKVGDTVEVGDEVASIGTSAAAVPVLATRAGSVTSIEAYPGQEIVAGGFIGTIEQPDRPLVAVVFAPVGAIDNARAGMPVEVIPVNVQVEEYGYLAGTVESVDYLPASREAIMAVLQDAELVERFLKNGPPVIVRVTLREDRQNPSGYAWSASAGPADTLVSGLECDVRVVLSRDRPITKVFPGLKSVLDE